MNKRCIYDDLTVEEYEKADYMMLVLAMKETVEMMDARDMSGLATFWEQCICWTRVSRVGPISQLADIFGQYRYIGIGKLDIGIGKLDIGIGKLDIGNGLSV